MQLVIPILLLGIDWKGDINKIAQLFRSATVEPKTTPTLF